MPSRKLLRTGSSMMRPEGSAIRPRMPPSWPMLPLLPRAPELVIIHSAPARSGPSMTLSSGFIMATIASEISEVVFCQTSTTCS